MMAILREKYSQRIRKGMDVWGRSIKIRVMVKVTKLLICKREKGRRLSYKESFSLDNTKKNLILHFKINNSHSSLKTSSMGMMEYLNSPYRHKIIIGHTLNSGKTIWNYPICMY